MRASIHPLFNANGRFGGYEQVVSRHNDPCAMLLQVDRGRASLPTLHVDFGMHDGNREMSIRFRDLARKHTEDRTYGESLRTLIRRPWDAIISRSLD